MNWKSSFERNLELTGSCELKILGKGFGNVRISIFFILETLYFFRWQVLRFK